MRVLTDKYDNNSHYKALKNDNGVALIVTLALIAILVAGSIELSKRVGKSTLIVMEKSNSLIAEQMALSGINLAMFILAQDARTSNIDSVQEEWADPYYLAKAVENLDFKKGKLELLISDEMGKIQVNALLKEYPGNIINQDQRKLWERILNLVISSDKSSDLRDPSQIINTLTDWLDSEDDDTVTGLSGAESEYYQSLEPAYKCSNGPFYALEEMFMVKGVSKDLLKSKNDFISSIELSSVFSVFGMATNKTQSGKFFYPGTININTADIVVLAAILPTGMEDQAEELIEFRSQKGEDEDKFINSLDKGWYKKIIDLSDKEKKKFERLVKYSSSVFSAKTFAVVENTQVALTGVIKRQKNANTGKWTCKLVSLF